MVTVENPVTIVVESVKESLDNAGIKKHSYVIHCETALNGGFLVESNWISIWVITKRHGR
jgi:hypothetical protein